MVDTHCHLDSCKPADGELVARARSLGVTRMATVGMDPQTNPRALAAARELDGVFAIVGRHPNAATGWSDSDIEEIERAASEPGVVAVGETGLDYFRDRAPREDQRRAFEAQLDLARRLDLPVAIHSRAADDDTMAVLAERADGLTVILHCFSMPDRVDEAVERGYVCSFAGNVTYPSAGDLQEAARQVPDDLLLVETDAPYLTPVPVRGEPNEPANVTHTAELVAGLRGVEYAELEAIVERNAARVFGW
ncbi:MAG: TatD family hydrolase [Thermoleophilaceae bacterium]